MKEVSVEGKVKGRFRVKKGHGRVNNNGGTPCCGEMAADAGPSYVTERLTLTCETKGKQMLVTFCWAGPGLLRFSQQGLLQVWRHFWCLLGKRRRGGSSLERRLRVRIFRDCKTAALLVFYSCKWRYNAGRIHMQHDEEGGDLFSALLCCLTAGSWQGSWQLVEGACKSGVQDTCLAQVRKQGQGTSQVARYKDGHFPSIRRITCAEQQHHDMRTRSEWLSVACKQDYQHAVQYSRRRRSWWWAGPSRSGEPRWFFSGVAKLGTSVEKLKEYYFCRGTAVLVLCIQIGCSCQVPGSTTW